jgi:hypothetical protein
VVGGGVGALEAECGAGELGEPEFVEGAAAHFSAGGVVLGGPGNEGGVDVAELLQLAGVEALQADVGGGREEDDEGETVFEFEAPVGDGTGDDRAWVRREGFEEHGEADGLVAFGGIGGSGGRRGEPVEVVGVEDGDVEMVGEGLAEGGGAGTGSAGDVDAAGGVRGSDHGEVRRV